MYMYTKLGVAFLTALILSFISTPIAIKLAPKIGAVDIPKDGRRMHSKPIPRFGGMAIFIGTTVSMIAFMTFDTRIIGVIIGGILIYALGVIDDLTNLPAKVKFGAQTMCAIILYSFNIRIEFVSGFFGEGVSYFGDLVCFLVTILWIVGITNTVNLIDGLDGLAAGTASIASLCIAYVAYIHGMYLVAGAMLAVAGGALGFLPFNFSPAKIFMGDGGSLFLGFTIAGLSILGPVKGATIIAVIVPLLVMGLPIFDTAFAIFRRIVNRRPIMEADKGHLHHRLMDIGLGQRRTVLMLYGISGIMGVGAVLISRDLKVEAIGLFFIALIYIYVFLTDATHKMPQIKAVNIAEDEKRLAKEEKKGKKIVD
ncbi:MAG: undecaprenyl/decaprenyl-phosphate alpha-N-acetylglucosaminyl 1-phosphate transferase [Clostridia bacterium]|nr:undecaprenyl/decaprenyl-phosphate alpha-N-acetylglucosaminyl 1-phosphate transferase [Clostridia bacterium]